MFSLESQINKQKFINDLKEEIQTKRMNKDKLYKFSTVNHVFRTKNGKTQESESKSINIIKNIKNKFGLSGK